MARNFRNRSHHAAPPIADLNVTNLIDLAFMLLIIFMVATPLIQQEQTLPVNLPVAAKSPQPKIDNERIESITIRADGTYALGSQVVTFAELSRALARFGAQTKPPLVSLRTDGNTKMQQVISVIDELKKNNLSRIQFPTQVAN